MENLDLREVVKKYLKSNGMSTRFTAKKIGISHTSLQCWLNNQRELNANCITKIKQFISGDYITTADAIAKDMIGQMEGENEL
ncbi:MAG: hypothetical protein LUG99_22775 [Lachnospiraceae bacterium]|nr:hypothetical protein [Lachnospiraceae bacterium]